MDIFARVKVCFTDETLRFLNIFEREFFDSVMASFLHTKLYKVFNISSVHWAFALVMTFINYNFLDPHNFLSLWFWNLNLESKIYKTKCVSEKT